MYIPDLFKILEKKTHCVDYNVNEYILGQNLVPFKIGYIELTL